MARKKLKKDKAESGGRDDPAQSERFINSAREAEADETETGADQAFKKVAKQHGRKGRK